MSEGATIDCGAYNILLSSATIFLHTTLQLFNHLYSKYWLLIQGSALSLAWPLIHFHFKRKFLTAPSAYLDHFVYTPLHSSDIKRIRTTKVFNFTPTTLKPQRKYEGYRYYFTIVCDPQQHFFGLGLRLSIMRCPGCWSGCLCKYVQPFHIPHSPPLAGSAFSLLTNA